MTGLMQPVVCCYIRWWGLIQPAIDELMQSVVYMNMHVYMYMCM